jgi:hypothetical protein
LGCEIGGITSADVLPSLAHEEALISLAIGRIGARTPLPHHNCGDTIERFVAYVMFAKAFEKPSDVYPCGFVRVIALSLRTMVILPLRAHISFWTCC